MTIPYRDVVLGVQHKSIPPAFWGRSAREVAAERHPLSEFATPLVTLDRSASDANVATVFGWMRDRGLEIAPHGKTTMAPELWRRLLDAGAWGITLATPWQAQVARAAGVDRILLANQVVDPVGAAWLAAETDAGADIACWVDSVEGVRRLGAIAGERPIGVLVEFGDPGGRTGARGLDAAMAVAHEAAAEPRLRLRGVAGYEGTYGDDRDRATIARVHDYLAGLRAFAEATEAAGLVSGDPIVTAGGSAWFDLVAEHLGPLSATMTVVVRSGAFQAHDDVYYSGISPFAETDLRLRAALTAWTHVLSRPEPGLALLDAGKRDVPFDKGLPVPLDIPGGRVRSLNDQHAYLEVPAEHPLAVGDIVRLGLSHPCTVFDRWRLIPEVDDATASDPRVVGFVETFF